MALADDLERNLASKDFDAVEDTWLALLEQPDTDLDVFLDAAKDMAAAGEDGRARPLLDMLDEQLRNREAWALRLEVLREVGAVMHDPARLHKAVVDTLRALHGEHHIFEAMVEHLRLNKAIEDTPKMWTKVNRLSTLMSFDIGSIVYMEGKGAGEVLESNMALESFKVRFEHLGEIRVGFRAAGKLLRPLRASHILRRKRDEREVLEALRDGNPPELLRIVLESYEDPRTGADIRRDLAGIVPDSRWSSWWATARKHPQVLADGKGRRAYRWAASSEDARGSVWETFQAAEPRRQIALLRAEGSRDPALKTRMSAHLVDLASNAADEDPGLACEIWFALDKHGEVPTSVSWRPAARMAAGDDLRPMLRGIEDRGARERVYRMAQQSSDDWQTLFEDMFWEEQEPRILDLLAEVLGNTDRARVDAAFDQLLAQPRKSPGAFVWFAERAAGRPMWLDRNPLRMLNQVLFALTDNTFATYKTRLLALFESGATVPRLLSVLSETQAPAALSAIEKTTVIDGYQKELLQNALYLKFPSLRRDEETPLYALPASIADKRQALKTLLEEEIPANRRAIEEARELGDLRENFEYKSARQRHEYLSARATELDNDLKRARPIEPLRVDGSEVIIGARVALTDADGGDRVITILGPWESDPEAGVLSNESAQAQALIGAKPGDAVTLGDVDYTVGTIEPSPITGAS
ncbi:MAG: GreA/GreB family elongation factor [Acidobacteriota bacterium]